MSTASLVPVSEYLSTSYHPDMEYIDGELLERNVGEWDHGWLQRSIVVYLAKHWDELGLLAVAEVLLKVKPTRFRVPDVMVVRDNPGEQIITRPPFLCIEILSPEDRMTSMQEKIDDYLSFGVENIWIIDPRRKKAFWADGSGIHEAVNGVLAPAGVDVQMDLAGMWHVRS